MDARWTLSELVAEVAARIAALPAPKNGQVRAVPDERTIRYYGTLGLLDRPGAMRGRTALYGDKHVAQVVAIKRLQTMGRALSEIQALWSTLDDATLSRMSGVALAAPARRGGFWKRAAGPDASTPAVSADAMEEPIMPTLPMPPTGPSFAPPLAPATPPALPAFDAGPPVVGVMRPADAPASDVELRIQLAPNVVITVALADDAAISPADVRALRAAAAPLLDALAARKLAVKGEPS
ncbi:MAG TPA: MerR family transcriptional regulator [Kofleriaceae bacterium]|nr:MerR family transcriptional regulator [Kofleriaceae bacterium]